MIGAEHVLAFNIALLAAWASPGPAMLIAIRAGLAGGFRDGLATGAGLALVAALWTGAALAGLDTVFALFPWAFGALKTVGALYLLWIAWRTWRGSGAPLSSQRRPLHSAFRTGVLVNLGNPKSVLFAAAVLVVIFPPDLPPAQMALVVGNHFALELALYALLAASLAAPAVARRYLSARRWVDRAASLVLGTIGLRLLGER